MATVTPVKVKVQLENERDVISKLKNINKEAEKINKKHISVKIKTNDLTNAKNAADSLSNAFNQTAEAQTSVEKENVKLGKSSSLLGNTIKGRLINGAINAVVNSFKAAYTEIAAVDGELAKIQRDSGASTEEMDRLGKSAYDTAQKYGVSAAEYLKSVGMFSKSDYKGAADQLGELALRTQVAGDMSAEAASDFLLAADAAYGYEGSISQLSALVDKADSIDDKFGITMQETAAALPLISGAAAKAGMSVDETIALMGTFSESAGVTVDSAAESMSALITGIMDGTGQNVNELTELLLEYSQSARDAAEGVTEVAEPMAVIRELAESGMGAEALETLAGALDGVFSTEQLQDFLGNFSMVDEMMNTMAHSAGSTDAEVAAALNSIDGKTQNLKTAWAGLVDTITDSELVKNGADLLTGFVSGLDNLLTPAIDKAKQKVGELNSEYEQMFGEGSRYDTLINKTEELTEAEKQEKAVLESRKRVADQERAQAANEEYEIWQRQYGTGSVHYVGIDGSLITGDQAMLSDFGSDLSHANANMTESSDFTAYQAELDSVISKYAEMYSSLVKFRDEGKETLSGSQEQFIGLYESMAGVTNELANGGELIEAFKQAAYSNAISDGMAEAEAMAAANEAVNAFKEALGLLPEEKTTEVEADTEDAEGKVSALQAALDKLASIYTADIVINQVGNVPSFGKFSGTRAAANGTKSAPGGLTLVNERGPELISANGTAYIAGGGEPTITDLPRGATVLTASQTKQALGGADPKKLFPAFQNGTGSTTLAYKEAQSEKFNKTIAIREKREAAKNTANWYAPAAAASAPAPEPPDFEALEKDLKETLKNLNLQAELAENQGRTNELLEIYGRAQSSIQGLLDKYLQNGYAADSTEVLTLTNSGYDYGRKQLKAYDSLKDELVDALNALTNATRDAEALEEKQLAVDKARQSLQNAENQRTVRIFNAESGQWEWVANAAEIERAQENLQRAEKALAQEQIQRDIEAIKNAEGDEILQVNFSTAMRELMRSGGAERLAELVRSAGGTVAAVDFMNTPGYETQFNRPAETNIGSQYYLDGITITENQASTMTLKELTDQLRILKLTS